MKRRWSVVGVVADGDAILAIARGFKPYDTNLPGGTAEAYDPTPVDTLKRELLLKTGIQVVGVQLIDTFDGAHDEPVAAYFVHQWAGKIRSGRAGKVFWAAPKQLITDRCTFQETNERLLRRLERLTASPASKP